MWKLLLILVVTKLYTQIDMFKEKKWKKQFYSCKEIVIRSDEVDSIMKGLIVNAYLLPWSDLEKCMYTTLF